MNINKKSPETTGLKLKSINKILAKTNIKNKNILEILLQIKIRDFVKSRGII